jgi:HEXXH motif-containing protein
MTLQPYRIGDADFRELGRGGGSASSLALLAAARRSKNLVLLRSVVEAGDDEVSRTYDVLAEVEASDSQAVARVLADPAATHWLARAARGQIGRRSRLAGLSLLTVAAAHRAAHRAGRGMRITVAAASATSDASVSSGASAASGADLPDRIGLPSLGTLALPPGPVEFWITPAGTRVRTGRTQLWIPPVHASPGARPPSRPGPSSPGPSSPGTSSSDPGGGWDPARTVRLSSSPPWMLQLDESRWLNPPAPSPGRPRLGEGELRSLWEPRLIAGWQLLREVHPSLGAEVRALFSTLLPLRDPAHGIRSATFRDAFGLVALSTPSSDPCQVAVALAHEAQHAKLAVLIDLFPLIRADARGAFYAPWREDPRPAGNLLHGAYAHLAVIAFWSAQRQSETSRAGRVRAEVEFVRWRTAASAATHALDAGEVLTDAGRRFVSCMLERLAEWNRVTVSAEAMAIAGRRALEHRRRWLAAVAG